MALDVPVIITEKQNLPSVLLRRQATDVNIIKLVVSAAFHSKPIIIMPFFTNKLKSISTMIEKGIIYYDNDYKEYKYLI